MPPVKAVVVCVNYDDLLAVTLPTVLPHVAELVVVTAPADAKTQTLVAGFPNARAHVTDAFYRGGAKFNKGLAMEEGFDALGRDGWLLVLDADILVPPDLSHQLDLLKPRPGFLYTPRRRILDEPKDWWRYTNPQKWASLPGRKEDKGHYGYFQLFHAADPVLRTYPWYATDFTHAGQCDDKFQHRWPVPRKVRPAFEVLHLGKCDENWFGRTTERMDGADVEGPVEERRRLQQTLRAKHGWGVKRQNVQLDEKVNPGGT